MNENLIGKTLANRYHISELIGTGGMASVYKGECNLLNRDVAIKVLRESVKDDADALEGFRKEAQAAASLSHNNIVSIYDIGKEDDFDYMVMEYVKGSTLKKYIQDNGPLPWQEVCDFGIQICQALEAAHAIGVVHRDIKPQNILITDEQELKVTDFGLAKAATSETLTMGGSAMGSVHYISPEQARGGFTDSRSDIYSLGIVLFEMLTGKVPFNSESAVSVALMHIEKEVPSVFEYTRSVPDDLVKVVAKASAKEPISRYQSVTDLINDLRAVLSFEPVEYAEDTYDDGDIGNTRKFNIDDDMIDDTVQYQQKNGKKQKRQKTPQEKKVDRFSTLMALLTVVVLIGIGIGAYALFGKGGKFSGAKETLMPDFANMTLEEAVALANENGIIISEELEYSLSDEIEEGKIISQLPEKGEVVDKNEPVRFVVSIGSVNGNISVPYIVGEKIDDAIETIMHSELTYLIIEEESDTVPKGEVIRQSPAVGTKLNKDGVVTIYFSSGKPLPEATPVVKETVYVPSLFGATRENAEIELGKYNLKLVSVSEKDSNLPAGTVISQNPEAGKPVEENSPVSIVISNGIATDTEFVAPTIPREELEENVPVRVTSVPVDIIEEEEEDGEEENTKLYTFQIPNGDGTANVKIIVDGDTLYENVKKFGETVSVDITGTGKKKVVAYVNGKIEDQQTFDLDE